MMFMIDTPLLARGELYLNFCRGDEGKHVSRHKPGRTARSVLAAVACTAPKPRHQQQWWPHHGPASLSELRLCEPYPDPPKPAAQAHCMLRCFDKAVKLLKSFYRSSGQS